MAEHDNPSRLLTPEERAILEPLTGGGLLRPDEYPMVSEHYPVDEDTVAQYDPRSATIEVPTTLGDTDFPAYAHEFAHHLQHLGNARGLAPAPPSLGIIADILNYEYGDMGRKWREGKKLEDFPFEAQASIVGDWTSRTNNPMFSPASRAYYAPYVQQLKNDVTGARTAQEAWEGAYTPTYTEALGSILSRVRDYFR